MHGSVLALEVVLSDGTIVQLGKQLRKDNTGYDLKQLFIGSEGTLGVISKVSILAAPKPKSVNVALLALENFEDVLNVYKSAKSELAEILSAFEFFDRASLDVVLKHTPHIRNPFSAESSKSHFYILIETAGSSQAHDSEKLNDFLESSLESELINDGVLAQDETQINSFWQLRETISLACQKEGKVFKYDLSVPPSQLYSLVTDMRQHLKSKEMYDCHKNSKDIVSQVIGFGHLGDGNLHLNIMASSRTPQLEEAIEPFIYQRVKALNGSISAEHGLGQHKAPVLHYSQPPEVIALMKQIKMLLDPKGILNPGKFFPPSE